MRFVLGVLALAGCGRIGFDAAEDAGDPLALTCNKPVRLVAGRATTPRLAALTTQLRIGATWVDDDGAIISGGAFFETADQLKEPVSAAFLPGNGPYSATSIAVNGNVLAGIGLVNNTSVVRLFDATTVQPTTPPGITLPIVITSAHAVASTGAMTGPLFAVVGAMGSNSLVFGVDAANQSTTMLDAGTDDSYLGIENAGTRLLIANVSKLSGSCEVRTAALDLTSTGATSTFGGATCKQPITSHGAGRSDFLILYNDDVSIQQVISTLNGTAITIGAVTPFSSGSEPRVTSIPDGYWATYHVSGTVRAKHLTFAGTEDLDMLVAPAPDDTSHDVIRRNGEAYAVWLSDALYVEHLCL